MPHSLRGTGGVVVVVVSATVVVVSSSWARIDAERLPPLPVEVSSGAAVVTVGVVSPVAPGTVVAVGSAAGSVAGAAAVCLAISSW